MNINNAAILAGGFGKRLGDITKKVPKPLLKINNLEFIKYLILKLVTQKFKRIIILTHYKNSLFQREFHNLVIGNTKIICKFEKKPLGTGGSLAQLKRYKRDFLILNGDSYINTNFNKFSNINKNKLLKIQLIKNTNYKSNNKLSNISVAKNNNVIFDNKKKLMNSGVYIIKKELLNKIKLKKQSFEEDIIPQLINQNKVQGYFSKNKFIDIGLKKNLHDAKKILKKEFDVKAIIFDRDGTLNKNFGYVNDIKKFKWLKGSIQTIKFLNFINIKVIIATNQSGIGRGYYSMSKFNQLNRDINKQLKKNHAFINHVYCAPYYKNSLIKKYRSNANLRKPNNGMLIQAMKDFKLNKKNCFMVGDKVSDENAAKNSNINFYYKKNISLFNQIIKNLNSFCNN